MSKRNAIILAAGTSSRFVPLSQECPKGLLEVKGEILIERQIRQLKEAGIEDITIVLGYKAEKFRYLQNKYGLSIVINEDYDKYNNTSSIIRVIEKLDNTFVCCSDHYFSKNVFIGDFEDSFYSALYSSGPTNEYCLELENDYIKHVSIGGENAWYMVGHVYFNHSFSTVFREIMKAEYMKEETRFGYWEDVYIKYIEQLPMKVNYYNSDDIYEFDSLDELRLFDKTYISDTRSSVIKTICKHLHCQESDVHSFKNRKHIGPYLDFDFKVNSACFNYNDKTGPIIINSL